LKTPPPEGGRKGGSGLIGIRCAHEPLKHSLQKEEEKVARASLKQYKYLYDHPLGDMEVEGRRGPAMGNSGDCCSDDACRFSHNPDLESHCANI